MKIRYKYRLDRLWFPEKACAWLPIQMGLAAPWVFDWVLRNPDVVKRWAKEAQP